MSSRTESSVGWSLGEALGAQSRFATNLVIWVNSELWVPQSRRGQAERGQMSASVAKCQRAFKILKTETRLQFTPRARPQTAERTRRHSFAPLADPIPTSLIFLPYLLTSSRTFALEKWHLNESLSHVPIFGGTAKGKRRPKNQLPVCDVS